MPAIKRHFLSLLALLLFFSSVAQSYSEDKNEFRQQAISRLKAIGTEPANKIAFDFQNAWDGILSAASAG